MIEVVVDSRLRLRRAQLRSEVIAALRAAFNHENPQYARLVAMGQTYTKEPKRYVMWRDSGDEMSLPRGGMKRMREIFDRFNVDYKVFDHRSSGRPEVTGSYVDGWQLGSDLFPQHKLVAWEHQVEIVAVATKYQQALIRAPTGSGKTSAVLKLIAELQVPALVIMWESGLLKQWQRRIEVELGIVPKDQGLIRGKTFRLKSITLAMQQTLNRWDEADWARLMRDGSSVFGGVYCDEIQRYSASTFTGLIDRFDSKYRVGVSADERRKDQKDFLIYDMFGEVRLKVSKAGLIKRGIIHEVECYIVPTAFTCGWFVARRAARQLDLADYGKLIREMQNDEDRNKLAVHLIEECVNAGLQTLTFTHHTDHARIIETALVKRGIATGMALGGPEWEKVFDETIAKLNSGELQVGCGTFGKLGAGHDVPTLAAGVAVTPINNNRSFMEQVKGRICRTTAGKENARILILWDRLVYGEQPLYNLRQWNKVCRVWCEWDARWKDIGVYMEEHKNGGYRQGAAQAADQEDIFRTAQ